MEDEQSDKRIKGWSIQERKELLECLKRFGSRNLNSITKSIPTKTRKQIREVLDYYREQLTPPANPPAKRKVKIAKTMNTQGTLPLRKWAKFLQENFKPEELHTDTAAAVRYIAEFEKIPPASQTNDIDFRKVYHALADAMEGKPIQGDEGVAAVLYKCYTETALTGREFMSAGAIQHAFQHIDLADKASSILPRASDDIGLSTLRSLASQKAYNPLNIPEQYLKPT